MRRILQARGLAVLAELGRRETLLAFDFDGTLAPIVEDRDRARMRARTRALLAKVCRLYPTAIISGRGRADVRRLLDGVRPKYLIGNHGLDKRHESRRTVKALDVPRMKLAVLASRLEGVELEDKRYSLTVHYRKAKDRTAARAAILMLLERLSCPVRIVPGKAVLNIVLEGTPHKGDALLTLTTLERVERALYVGDDSTDEDVFRLDEPELLVGVRVGRSSRSAAKWFLGQQAEIDDLLRALIKARKGAPLSGRSRGSPPHPNPLLRRRRGSLSVVPSPSRAPSVTPPALPPARGARRHRAGSDADDRPAP